MRRLALIPKVSFGTSNIIRNNSWPIFVCIDCVHFITFVVQAYIIDRINCEWDSTKYTESCILITHNFLENVIESVFDYLSLFRIGNFGWLNFFFVPFDTLHNDFVNKLVSFGKLRSNWSFVQSFLELSHDLLLTLFGRCVQQGRPQWLQFFQLSI